MNRAVAISITMLCVAAALPPGVVRAQSTVTIDPSPPSASVAPGDTGAFPATEATESTPGRSAVAEQLLWTAGALQSLLAEGDYATTLLLAAANRAAAEAPDGFVGDGVRSLAAAMESGPTRQRLQQCRAARDEIENALCSIETLAAAAPNGVGRLLTDAGARLVGDAFRAGPTRGLPVGFVSRQLGGTYASAEPLQRFAEPVLEEALRLALSGGDSGFRELVGTVVGIDPGASLESLVSAPAIANLLGVNPTLARLSEGEAALRDVVAHYQGVVDSSAQSLAGILGALTGAGGEDPENILTQALDLRLEWAADRSLSYLASRAAALMGEDDGTVARVRAIGSAIADLKLGAASFAEQLASFGQQAAAASLAGNVLSVAMGVTSFFGLTPGALGPASARDVRALRAAVDTIRAELHGRFDTVDASLDTLMLAVGTGFERLESLVASGNADVQAHLTVLTRELSTLGQRLDRMETNLLTYMQDGFSREYNRTLVRCLEHRERLLPPYDEMEFQVFSDCLAEFRTRAVRDARDALLTDQTTPVDDASLASTLASGDDSLDSLGRQLSLLGRAAQERFGYAGMRGGRGVANPVEWAIAAQAYLTLLHDWPQHAGAVTTGDLEAILAVGKEISDVLS
ncbi:MAG TPA: hypothetical protein VNZ57_13655, partial [Longimicrobiales bacterium]|nr:hypothetical protein [Longimicrobiales bacterium]